MGTFLHCCWVLDGDAMDGIMLVTGTDSHLYVTNSRSILFSLLCGQTMMMVCVHFVA